MLLDDCFMKTLRLMSESGSTGSVRLGMEEAKIQDYVEVGKYICSILHYHINVGNNFLYNLLDYGNGYTKNLTTKE